MSNKDLRNSALDLLNTLAAEPSEVNVRHVVAALAGIQDDMRVEYEPRLAKLLQQRDRWMREADELRIRIYGSPFLPSPPTPPRIT